MMQEEKMLPEVTPVQYAKMGYIACWLGKNGYQVQMFYIENPAIPGQTALAAFRLPQDENPRGMIVAHAEDPHRVQLIIGDPIRPTIADILSADQEAGAFLRSIEVEVLHEQFAFQERKNHAKNVPEQ